MKTIDRRLLIVLLILGVLLIVVAGVIYFTGGREQTPMMPEITPPASLEELAQQYPELSTVLDNPELASVYKDFLIAYQEGGEEAALELARKRDMLTPDGDVAVTLVLDTDEHGPLVAQLEGVGVTVVSAYRDRVNVAVPLALIEAQLERDNPGAVFEHLTELEHVIGVQLPAPRVNDGSGIKGEGVDVIGAGVWHQAGFTGAGLRIGVLDLGFAGYEALLSTDLPDSVVMQTFGWHDSEESHGTACAEIVHEVAPEAALFFAWYDGSDAAMGEAVDWLLAQGVHIISHSASGISGPRNGTGWDARLVDEVARRGVLWVNSSGNKALAHYRGVFTDEDGDGIHEFAPGEEMLALYNKRFVLVALNWDDDWERASQDYELFLYDVNGNELASSQDTQSGELGHEPVEWLRYETGGAVVYAVVLAYQIDEPAILDIFVNGAEVAYPSPAYSLCPPADAVGSLTVGAANWQDDSLAEYSSQGPSTDGRLKPEISAPTGVSGAIYGAEGFHGTSASCPHVAGAAALVWQAYPDFSRQEVTDFLLTHALDLGEPGPDTGYGYGRLQLPSPPDVAAAPHPTATPMPEPVSGPTATPAPLSTPTAVAYATPIPPAPPSGDGSGLLALTGLGIISGGLCCLGGGLLLFVAMGIFIARRQRPVPPPVVQPEPYVPEPPPVYPTPVPSPSPSPPPPSSARCPACGDDVRPDARFCPTCGQTLQQEQQPQRCRHCGQELREGARFCPKCGETV
ncbi:MAG TPA: zinc-ribbon domain-containing protein [Chloroflexi bacterium]|nr:zinc-ribbon domain-containing protein [Chloroflexota bacterium]